ASLQVEPQGGVTIRPGKSVFLRVRLERRGYQEEIPLQVDGLPDHVRPAGPVSIAVGQESAEVELRAAAHAAEGEVRATVSARLGDARTEREVRVRVQKPRVTVLLPGRGD